MSTSLADAVVVEGEATVYPGIFDSLSGVGQRRACACLQGLRPPVSGRRSGQDCKANTCCDESAGCMAAADEIAYGDRPRGRKIVPSDEL